MLRLAAACSLVLWLAAPALAQSRSRSIVTLSLDVIGPRTTVSVRSSLRAHEADFDRCRGDAEGLVRVAFSIAPDGAALAPTSDEDPSLDRAATECVLGVMASVHFAHVATSTTSVAWAFRLRARQTRPCWCFDWVHGPDHGHTCEPTRARCETEHRTFSRERTECRASQEPSCEHDGWIDGQHLRESRER